MKRVGKETSALVKSRLRKGRGAKGYCVDARKKFYDKEKRGVGQFFRA